MTSVRQQSERERLAHAPLVGIGELWIAGPFDDGERGFATPHPPEQAAIDLNASYKSGERTIRWEKLKPAQMFNFRKHYG